MMKKMKIVAMAVLFVLFFNIAVTSLAVDQSQSSEELQLGTNINNQEKELEAVTMSDNDVEEYRIENTVDEQEEILIQDEYPKQGENSQTIDTKNRIATFSADPYEGNKLEGKSETNRIYVQRDGKTYTYTRVNGANFIRIKRFCFETNEYVNVFDNWNQFDVEMVNGYYIQDKIIYTAFYGTTDYDELEIIGFDTQSETVVYHKTFPIVQDIFHGDFVMSKNQFAYIVTHDYDGTEVTISSYNANGELIDSTTQPFLERYEMLDLAGVKNDNNVLFFALKTFPSFLGTWWDDYVIKMENGKFVNDTAYKMREAGGIIWKFLDESQTHAYTQYGEVYEIDYNADNEAGIDYIIKKSISIDGSYAKTNYLSSFDDTYIYLGAQKGMLYIVNWHTYEIEKSLCIGETKTITSICKPEGENEFWIEYFDSTTNSPYTLKLSVSDYSEVKKDIPLTDHTSLTHTKLDIKNKYDELSIVNKTSDLYDVKPSTTSPYAEGSLKQQVKTDTLNQINYFRWLAGLNSVTINNNYMSYSQKGATVLAANNLLTHNPAQPEGMDDTFYSQGYDATSAGIGTSANISQGSLLAYSIQGYIDDTSNYEPNVGHRLSLLDKNAESVSFGYANSYGVVNVFTNNSVTNPDYFHAWPSPGNFPVESVDSYAMWSVEMPDEEYYISGSKYVVIKANGKEYSSGTESSPVKLYLDRFYNTYYFDLPQEVRNYLTDGTYNMKDGKTVEIEVHGIADNYGNTYVLTYPIKFFSLDNVLTGISLPKTMSITQNTTKKLELTMTPSTAVPDGTIEWSSSNPNIASINADGTITAKAIGETTITAKVDGFTATTTVKVVETQLGDVNKDTNIDMLDYVLILSHVRETKLLSGEALELADVNTDGIVDMLDYVLVLSHVRGTKPLY